MAKVKEIEVNDSKTRYEFHCPACDRIHAINDSWKYNDDPDNPTFKPSVKGFGKRPNKDGEWVEWICHSFIEDGQIRFLNDCTHELAGQTVELPEIE